MSSRSLGLRHLALAGCLGARRLTLYGSRSRLRTGCLGGLSLTRSRLGTSCLRGLTLARRRLKTV